MNVSGLYEEGSLFQKMKQNRIDWRFANEYGLSEKELDCRQLSIMEVLHWKAEPELIRTFLHPFDCQSEQWLLRRSEPTLKRGWDIKKSSLISAEDLKKHITSHFHQEGYCIIYYKAYDMFFSSYYQQHDVVHWGLVVHCDEKNVIVVDNAGSPSYFEGMVGTIPWETFLEAWSASEGGIATVYKDINALSQPWSVEFHDILVESVSEMVHKGGLDNLRAFITSVEQLDPQTLIAMIEQLEFDIHYFRRLRELWKLAVNKEEIPKNYLKPVWIEELFDASHCWSLVMGVLLKWKRQPERDYKKKLMDYLWEAFNFEQRLMRQMTILIGK